MAEKLAKNFSLDKQDVPSGATTMLLDSEDPKEQLLEECEEIWKQVEECQNRLTLQDVETLPDSDLKLSLLIKRFKALTAEFNQWQKRTPEIMTRNSDVLVALGRDQLQKLDHELEMVLSTVNAKNKKLKEDLIREQKWLEEQQQIIDCLNQTEEEMSNQVVYFSEKRAFQELKSKMLQIKAYKEDVLNALGDFLEEHFPLPENSGTAKKKRHSSEEQDVQLISLHEILENLINKLVNTPHDPHITITASFWSPYIELLLRYGIALRHPEDPNKIRLEKFDQ
ncbi:centromere protein K isoform X2 [Python bivittatus]|uniref:Centromere protein K isoform X1 n=2 Tax=Python bivittatus TaxID=176946 RepID=A0A9F5I9S4_PYTBI|nr:centromere protein K isoform X1 [Python bivittatus]XP_025019075.1 centromere protein K isoform X2 [Python bivittatus]